MLDDIFEKALHEISLKNLTVVEIQNQVRSLA